jgi:hypothetical protein
VLDLMRQSRADARARRTRGPDRDDDVLKVAGIEPDHPSLWETG